jgi:hypothetical protein
MVCELGEEELFILNILYVNRNFNKTASYNSKLLADRYRRKFNDDPKDAIKALKNNGYIAQVRKKDIKYYLDDKPKAFFALSQHGYSIVSGPRRL